MPCDIEQEAQKSPVQADIDSFNEIDRLFAGKKPRFVTAALEFVRKLKQHPTDLASAADVSERTLRRIIKQEKHNWSLWTIVRFCSGYKLPWYHAL